MHIRPRTPETFSDEYRRIFPTVSTAREEPSDGYETESRVTEDLVKCLWAGAQLDQGILKTADDLPVHVFSPGQWNLEGGPDFKRAEIQFGSGGRIIGDVEVHLHPSGWRQHGHFRDPAYDNVILIVELEGSPRQPFEETLSGRRVPRLVLEHCQPGLGKSLRAAPSDSCPSQLRLDLAGACGRKLEVENSSRLERLLDLAGEWRLLTKATRISAMIGQTGLDQTLYETLMEVLGYKAHKTEFLHIARSLPLVEMRRVAQKLSGERLLLGFQAILFACTDLLPTQIEHLDDETRRYLTSLHEILSFLGADISPIVGLTWRRVPTRPANSPLRRVAAASYLLSWLCAESAEEVLKRAFAAGRRRATTVISDIADKLFPHSDEYWMWRFAWDGRRAERLCAIIGRETLKLVVVNTLIPFAVAQARETGNIEMERNALGLFRAFPSLSSNSVTRYMRRRFTGGDPTPSSTFRGARRQLGLIQLHHDWCAHNPSCHQCAVPPLL